MFFLAAEFDSVFVRFTSDGTETSFLGMASVYPKNFWGAPLVGVYALTHLLNFADLYLRHVLGERFILDLRVLLYEYLQRLSLSFFESQQTGEIMSRVTNDVNALEEFVTHSVGFLIVDLLRLVGTAVILIALDWQLALLTLLPVPILAVGLRWFNTRVRPIYRQIRDRLGDINAELQDNISGIRVIQAFSQEEQELDRFTQRSTSYYQERVRGIRLSNALNFSKTPFSDTMSRKASVARPHGHEAARR